MFHQSAILLAYLSGGNPHEQHAYSCAIAMEQVYAALAKPLQTMHPLAEDIIAHAQQPTPTFQTAFRQASELRNCVIRTIPHCDHSKRVSEKIFQGVLQRHIQITQRIQRQPRSNA